ncbi:MAG: rod shape-determining protein, partial [Clostridia bacterium]|nr:rod shape-determining protein [Clostridia bacterium]
MGAFRQNIAVDIGSSNIRICVERKGIVVEEPSVVAVRKQTGEVVAIGRKAKNMEGKTDKDVSMVRPI